MESEPDSFHQPEHILRKRRRSLSVTLQRTNQSGQYLVTAEDMKILQDMLQNKLHLEKTGEPEKHRFPFRERELTRQFSTFDRQNPKFASSEFHGFLTLFWLGVAWLLVKVGANNWRVYGTIWGKNEIIRLMFHKDVLVLGLSDFVLCWSTLFCLILQHLILKGYVRWIGFGWVIQNVSPGLLHAAKLRNDTANSMANPGRFGKPHTLRLLFGGPIIVTGLGHTQSLWFCMV